MSIRIASFYQFVKWPDYASYHPLLKRLFLKNGIKGTLILAHEGLNGTIAGPVDGLQTVIDFICGIDLFKDLKIKYSTADQMPFHRAKVRIKSEIVTLGIPGLIPAEKTGQHISPAEWNKLLQDPEVVCIDFRNQYETSIGTFEGAVQPPIRASRDFPDYLHTHFDPKVHKKIAMCCTGGIRCERASAYVLEQGFETVYQLDGGILNYLEHMPADQSRWQGDCFVFDGRVSVSHSLTAGEYIQCHGCRHPVSAAERQSPDYVVGISCPHCINALTDKHVARATARQRQVELAKKRGHRHVGAIMPAPRPKNMGS